MSYPAWVEWGSAVASGEPLSMATIEKAKSAIWAQETKPVVHILPPLIYGNDQKSRRRRTVFVNGRRIVLPSGSHPYIYFLSNGERLR